MNAEIGAYQPDGGEGERGNEPIVQVELEDPTDVAILVHCG